MDLAEILSLTGAGSILITVVGHLLSKRKIEKDLQRTHIDNVDAATETWQKIVDKLERRIDGLLELTTKVRNENISLKEEIYQLREELVALRHSQKKIEKYEKQIKQLEDKILKYEKIFIGNNIVY